MAAKEKGKIVSASPDSPTLEKLSTFSQQIRSALHCFSAVATRTNALRQSVTRLQALMSLSRRNPHECAEAKVLGRRRVEDTETVASLNASPRGRAAKADKKQTAPVGFRRGCLLLEGRKVERSGDFERAPEFLLGLTATPERMDGENILPYFNNKLAAEIRLPEAINRKLLCPFQYFGVADSVDLSNLNWTRGGSKANHSRNWFLQRCQRSRNFPQEEP